MLKRIFIVSFCALAFLCSCSKEQLDKQEIKVYGRCREITWRLPGL